MTSALEGSGMARVLSFIARRTRSFAQYRTDTEKERARLKLNLGIGDSQVA